MVLWWSGEQVCLHHGDQGSDPGQPMKFDIANLCINSAVIDYLYVHWMYLMYAINLLPVS